MLDCWWWLKSADYKFHLYKVWISIHLQALSLDCTFLNKEKMCKPFGKTNFTQQEQTHTVAESDPFSTYTFCQWFSQDELSSNARCCGIHLRDGIMFNTHTHPHTNYLAILQKLGVFFSRLTYLEKTIREIKSLSRENGKKFKRKRLYVQATSCSAARSCSSSVPSSPHWSPTASWWRTDIRGSRPRSNRWLPTLQRPSNAGRTSARRPSARRTRMLKCTYEDIWPAPLVQPAEATIACPATPVSSSEARESLSPRQPACSFSWTFEKAARSSPVETSALRWGPSVAGRCGCSLWAGAAGRCRRRGTAARIGPWLGEEGWPYSGSARRRVCWNPEPGALGKSKPGHWISQTDCHL